MRQLGGMHQPPVHQGMLRRDYWRQVIVVYNKLEPVDLPDTQQLLEGLRPKTWSGRTRDCGPASVLWIYSSVTSRCEDFLALFKRPIRRSNDARSSTQLA